ncbi:hypothetical protein SK128_024464 [Halocaridina rubra]|uniref:Uncharacterized protein n=1 Tax=Halocaridina rubra TaxID=373956 RepID=A0AAN8XLU0_HALRR
MEPFIVDTGSYYCYYEGATNLVTDRQNVASTYAYIFSKPTVAEMWAPPSPSEVDDSNNTILGCNILPHTVKDIMQHCSASSHTYQQHNIHCLRTLWISLVYPHMPTTQHALSESSVEKPWIGSGLPQGL